MRAAPAAFDNNDNAQIKIDYKIIQYKYRGKLLIRMITLISWITISALTFNKTTKKKRNNTKYYSVFGYFTQT